MTNGISLWIMYSRVNLKKAYSVISAGFLLCNLILLGAESSWTIAVVSLLVLLLMHKILINFLKIFQEIYIHYNFLWFIIYGL